MRLKVGVLATVLGWLLASTAVAADDVDDLLGIATAPDGGIKWGPPGPCRPRCIGN